MAVQKKRFISLSLLVGMVSLLLTVPVFAEYENTHINTGDQAADILAIADTQVGYAEGNNNYTKYGAWYPMNYNPWCAMFVSWCAEQAGIPQTVIPKHASCDVGMNWFKNKKLWQDSAYHGGTYIPQAGDIIYFGVIGDSNHVGIVRYTADGYVYTVEGNASDMVINKSYSLDSERILGYGIPAYADAQTVSGMCGVSAGWTLHLDSGRLIISGTGDMQGWTLPGDQPWAPYFDKIQSAVVEIGISSVGVNAFAGCTKLTSVSLPSGLTKIRDGAFMGCTALTEITIPDTVTETGNYAFYGCSSLKNASVMNAALVYGAEVFFGTPSDFVLHGYSDSTSRSYAGENNHRFSALDVPDYLTGDITEDGSVDIDDAIFLFQHTMLPELYPVSYGGNMDFTQDGSVDIDDAILLFRHSMMPDSYPID